MNNYDAVQTVLSLLILASVMIRVLFTALLLVLSAFMFLEVNLYENSL